MESDTNLRRIPCLLKAIVMKGSQLGGGSETCAFHRASASADSREGTQRR